MFSNPTDLRHRVDRPPTARGVERLRAVAAKVHLLSPTAQQLLDPAACHRLSLRDLAYLVQTDAALAAHLLRLANSSFFGLSRKVTTLAEAVVLVGWKGVRNLAVCTSVTTIARQEVANPWIQEKARAINEHCLATAVASRRCGKLMKSDQEDELFLAGLIHDLGRVVLMMAYPADYQMLWNQAARDGSKLAHLEQERLGIDHVQTLELVGRDWNLPGPLLELVAAHHTGVRTVDSIWLTTAMTILQAGNALAKVARLGDSGDPHIEIEPFCRLLAFGWSPEQLSDEAEHLVEEFHELQAIIGIATEKQDSPGQTVYQDFFRITARSCTDQGYCRMGAAS